MLGNKVDNQITKRLWIINTFWNIYPQDNYHFKDLGIRKNGLIFRIHIKNESKYNSRLKNPQKMSSNWTKTQTRARPPKGPFGTFGCRLAQIPGSAQGLLDWDKAYLFQFFQDKDTFQFVSNHSANFSKHPNLYK